MTVVRPRGGRAAPRYHHVRDAAENKAIGAMRHKRYEGGNTYKSQAKKPIDELIRSMAKYRDEFHKVMDSINLTVLADLLMRPCESM